MGTAECEHIYAFYTHMNDVLSEAAEDLEIIRGHRGRVVTVCELVTAAIRAMETRWCSLPDRLVALRAIPGPVKFLINTA